MHSASKPWTFQPFILTYLLNTQGDSFFYDKMPSVINKPRNCIGNGMFAKNVKRLECVKQKGNKKHTHQHTQKYIHGWKLLPSTRPVVIRRVLTNECSAYRWNEMNRDREREEGFVQKENGNRTCQTEAKYLVEAIFHTAIIRYLGHRVNSKKLKMKISFKGFYKWQLLHFLFMFVSIFLPLKYYYSRYILYNARVLLASMSISHKEQMFGSMYNIFIVYKYWKPSWTLKI